jgi:hypothetical protein
MENFLTEEQTKKIKSISWDARPKGFYITLFKKEYGTQAWKQICEIGGVVTDVESITILGVGVKTK